MQMHPIPDYARETIRAEARLVRAAENAEDLIEANRRINKICFALLAGARCRPADVAHALHDYKNAYSVRKIELGLAD